ncbi:hypothetical protein E5288_WYG005043 [Bos mutus]|uniref:Uncharacterized protein n=1 Tax=Bos mutus TaxID=72004 RepID=A0A6B0QVS4_9CETA|nr:hypothetical protein [Bos mutus]
MQASSWRGCLVEAEGTFSAILCSRGHSIPDEDVHGEDVSPGTRTQAGVFSVPFCAHGRVRRIAFLIEIHWVCF